MTKQEYENKRIELLQDCETENDYYVNSDKLRKQYIESLEAENAKLQKALAKAAFKLAVKCPPTVKEGDCPQPDNIRCHQCWREYLIKEVENENLPKL